MVVNKKVNNYISAWIFSDALQSELLDAKIVFLYKKLKLCTVAPETFS